MIVFYPIDYVFDSQEPPIELFLSYNLNQRSHPLNRPS